MSALAASLASLLVALLPMEEDKEAPANSRLMAAPLHSSQSDGCLWPQHCEERGWWQLHFLAQPKARKATQSHGWLEGWHTEEEGG